MPPNGGGGLSGIRKLVHYGSTVWFAIAAALYFALRDADAEGLGRGFARARQWLRDAFRP